MIKNSLVVASIVVSVWMNGCGEDSQRGGDNNVAGPSAGGSKSIGSLSGSEDIGGYLKEKVWKSISLDLEKFVYDRDSRTKSYEMEMAFDGRKVNVLADCQYISANYRLRDDEIVFSKVSAPRPAVDLPSCKEVTDAESAVSNFFIYTYAVKTNTQNEVVFEGTDIETSVTLKR